MLKVNKNHPPLVTIITPVYNAEEYICQTIESVLSQDYSQLEYIILNDGSTDRTSDLLQHYSDKAKIIEHPNMGEGQTVNKGISLAKGKIIAVVNAEDPIIPGLITKAVKLLEARPELVAVYPDWMQINQDGDVTNKVRVPEYNYLMMLEQHYCFIGPGAFFRKASLGSTPPRDPNLKYSGDFDFWIRLGLKGPMARIPDFLATWRLHDNGASIAKRNQELADNRIDLIRKLYQRENLPPEVINVRRQAFSAAYYGAGLQALYNPGIKGRKHLLKSILLSPIWPKYFISMQKRSWLRMAYIFFFPFSRFLYNLFANQLENQRDGKNK